MGLVFGVVGVVLVGNGVSTIRGVAPFNRLRGGSEMSADEQKVFGGISIAVGILIGVAGAALALTGQL